ncbi:hypothetical protein ABKN59_003754 [Abortiporus biennis]
MSKAPKHQYNTRSRMTAIERYQAAFNDSPDRHRITVGTSATGQGTHVRWNYAAASLPPEGSDGGDDLEQLSTSSVAEATPPPPDVDRHIPRTPSRHGIDYDPGSVILTPVKPHLRQAVPLQRSPERIRASGGDVRLSRPEQSLAQQRAQFLAEEAKNRKRLFEKYNIQEIPITSEHDRIHMEQYYRLCVRREDVENAQMAAAEGGYFEDDSGIDLTSDLGEEMEMEMDFKEESDEENTMEVAGTSGTGQTSSRTRPLAAEATIIIDPYEPSSSRVLSGNSSRIVAQALLGQPSTCDSLRVQVSSQTPSDSTTLPELSRDSSSSSSSSSFVTCSSNFEHSNLLRAAGNYTIEDGQWVLHGQLDDATLLEIMQTLDNVVDGPFKQQVMKMARERFY